MFYNGYPLSNIKLIPQQIVIVYFNIHIMAQTTESSETLKLPNSTCHIHIQSLNLDLEPSGYEFLL